MKKLLMTTIAIILLSFVSTNSFAAIASDTVWEVRTTGSATNGGGYSLATGSTKSGSDYSQQDAAQLSLTDLAMNQGTRVLTSATGGFTTQMVGNLIYIASGTNFVAGFYMIDNYTNTNTVNLDRSAATAGNGSSGVGSVGGASDHPNTISTSVVAGNTIYIAGGTYNEVGANDYVLTPGVAGGATTLIKWIGYTAGTSRSFAYGLDRPLFDATGVNSGVVLGSSYNIFYNLRVSGSAGNGLNGTGDDRSIYFVNIKSSNNGSRGFYAAGSTYFSCESNNNGNEGFYKSSSYSPSFYYSYSHDNGSVGMGNSTTTNAAYFCISDSNSSHGFESDYFGSLIGNVAYNNTGSNIDGFNNSSWSNNLRAIFNNVSVSNARYGFNSSSVNGLNALLFDYNIYYGNGTSGLNNLTAGPNDSTSDPSFTDAAGGDFTYSSSSSPAVGTGFTIAPGSSLVGDYNWNIGVDQGDHVAAGSTASGAGPGWVAIQ